MFRHRGPTGFKTVPSKHNQRIERVWRDISNKVTWRFRNAFIELESIEGALDIANDFDLFVLHFVFIPALNQSLEKFRLDWNFHRVRTEKRTPNNMMFEDQHLWPEELVLDPTDYLDNVVDEDEDEILLDADNPYVEIIPRLNPFSEIDFAILVHTAAQHRIELHDTNEVMIMKYLRVLLIARELYMML